MDPLDNHEKRLVAGVREALGEIIEDEQQQEGSIDLPLWFRRAQGILRSLRASWETQYQRASYGYGEGDAENGTTYLLFIISGIVEELRLHGDGGYPIELDDLRLARDEEDYDALEEWYTILRDIEIPLRRYALCVVYSENVTTDELLWAEEEAHLALLMFSRWFPYLHE